MSPTIAALAASLAAAQATIGGAVKGKTNPAFKTKYADLSAVWEAWQEVGPAQGLAVVQLPGKMIEGRVNVTTMLMHKSGEWMRETLSIPVTKADAQGYGSALTYARRYALSALTGIAPEDDDGNASVRRDVPTRWPDSVNTMIAGIAAAADAMALRGWLKLNKPAVDLLDPMASSHVIEAYNARKITLAPVQQQEAA